MLTAARLHRGNLFRILNVADVEYADALEPILAHRVAHTLRAAIDAGVRHLGGEKQELAVNDRIHLATGAHECGLERELCWIGGVPDLESVEASLNDEILAERQV